MGVIPIMLAAIVAGVGSLFFTIPAWGLMIGLGFAPVAGSSAGALAAIFNSFPLAKE